MGMCVSNYADTRKWWVAQNSYTYGRISKKMKLMLLGDTHGNVAFMVAAIDQAKKMGCGAIYQLGDFGIWDHQPGGVYFLDKTEEALVEEGLELIFIDGNHENFDSLYALPIEEDGFRLVRDHIRHAPRGHIWDVDETTFLAMGGAHSIDGPGGVWTQARGPGNGWWPQETITPDEVYRALHNIEIWHKPVDVMLCHDVPIRSPLPGITGYPAGDENRRLLQQVADAAKPLLIACGHMHRFHSEVIETGHDREQLSLVEVLTGETSFEGQFRLIETNPFTYIKDSNQEGF